MGTRHTFKRDPAGRVIFDREQLKIVDDAIKPLGMTVSVTRDVRDQAERRLVEIAEELAFATNRPLLEALNHVCTKTHRELLRLSRADVADPSDADVGTEDE